MRVPKHQTIRSFKAEALQAGAAPSRTTMIIELQGLPGLGHRIFSPLGRIVGVADDVLIRNAVILEQGSLNDMGVLNLACRGEICSVWGLLVSEHALQDDVNHLMCKNVWPRALPMRCAREVGGRLYMGYRDLVCTADLLYVHVGFVFCAGESSVPQQ